MHQTKQITIALLVGFFSFAGWTMYHDAQADNGTYEEISPAEFGSLYSQGGFHVIDLRSITEQAQNTIIPSVYSLDITNKSDEYIRSELADYNLTDKYIIYDRAGRDTSRVIKIMREMGFSTVYAISGGYRAWVLYTGK